MYKLSIDKPLTEDAGHHLVIEGPDGEQMLPLSRSQACQLLGKMDVLSTGEPHVIEDFPAPDVNPGGEAPFGTLTSWPIDQIATPDAIRQALLEPVEAAIKQIAELARAANIAKPTIGTLEVAPGDEERLAIPEDILSAIRERVETLLAEKN